MKRFLSIFSLFMLLIQATITAQAETRASCSSDNLPPQFLIVTASNSPAGNELLVYNSTGLLIQAVPTGGLGGVSGNAGGIARYGKFLAVVNFNSSSVSLFELNHDHFDFIQIIPTISPPVSVAFGHNHLYILGTTTVESHRIDDNSIFSIPDGVATLLMANGSAAQVGVLEDDLIISEKNNALELAHIFRGAVTGAVTPVQLAPPPNDRSPFGLITRDNVAYVSFSTSNLVAAVKGTAVVDVAPTQGQGAPCWVALLGHYLYSSNAAGHSISLFEVFGKHINLINPIAAQTLGAPIDIDGRDNLISVLNNGTGVSYLSQYEADRNGNLTPLSSFVTLAGSNGIAIILLPRHHH